MSASFTPLDAYLLEHHIQNEALPSGLAFESDTGRLLYQIAVHTNGTGPWAAVQAAVNTLSDGPAILHAIAGVDLNKPPPVAGTANVPWTIYTLADAYKLRPPLDFLVNDLIQVPTLALVYGPPGSLKSLLIADMQVCVAAGIPWLSPKDPRQDTARRTLRAPTLWIDLDNGKRRTHERLKR
jgi:hypothetical protein